MTIDVVRQMVTRWRSHRLTGLAAEVAFFAVLGLFPGMLAVASVLGLLQGLLGREVARQAEDTIVRLLQQVLKGNNAGVVDGTRRLFAQDRPGVFTAGAVAALVPTVRAVLALIRALEIAYGRHLQGSRWRRGLVALGLGLGTVLVAALGLGLVVLGPLLGNAHQVANSVGLGHGFATFWSWLRWPTVTLVLVCWAAVLYAVAPGGRRRWRHQLPGAACAALMWVGASIGLRAYLDTGISGALGLLGGTLSLLVWIYLICLGLLLGGELNAVLSER